MYDKQILETKTLLSSGVYPVATKVSIQGN